MGKQIEDKYIRLRQDCHVGYSSTVRIYGSVRGGGLEKGQDKFNMVQ